VTEPDEPTLHLLLGDLYDRTGHKNPAADEYGEAEFLSKGGILGFTDKGQTTVIDGLDRKAAALLPPPGLALT